MSSRSRSTEKKVLSLQWWMLGASFWMRPRTPTARGSCFAMTAAAESPALFMAGTPLRTAPWSPLPA
jgi:hypothetical protein